MCPALTYSSCCSQLAIIGCLIIAISCPAVGATEPLSINAIMRYSGLTGQLDTLADELLPSIEQTMSTCKQKPASILTKDFPARYTSHTLQLHARQFLEGTLDSDTVQKLSIWYRSEHGLVVADAERSAALWSMDLFDQRLDQLEKSPSWNRARKKQILGVISATGAHTYVASLTTSVEELKTLLSLCSAGFSPDNRSQAMIRIENNRALMAAFIRMELLLPSGAVLAEVPDQTLDAYRAFALSPAGQQFHVSLARVFEHILFDFPSSSKSP